MKKESVFTFDLNVFSMNSIKKAAYKFSRDYLIEIKTAGNVAEVTATKTQSIGSRWDIENLPNEVLDQDLREIILNETNIMRDVILAQAFSSVPILHGEFETLDYEDDPLNISDAHNKTDTDD